MDDREGVLQDVHWATGAFGYFPSYSVGTLISAHWWDAMQLSDPELVKKIKNGTFLPILQWLRTHVHGLGRRYSTRDLVKVVTGQELSAEPLIRYLQHKYYGHFGIDA
jgi:carboxypeptidase Taq